VKNDGHFDLNETTVADLLEDKGYTWKSYQEDYPEEQGCYTNGDYQKLYYRKHNPFMSFISVSQNKTRCEQHIVNAKQLQLDIQKDDLPNLMYYTPNINNDGHNTGLKYADNFLSKFLPPLIENKKFMNGTLIAVTFDEDDYVFITNKVYMTLVGPMATPGKVDSTYYTHYSLLRTILDNFELGSLGRQDRTAPSFNCLDKSKKYYH
jgi:phospholipase C